jgi:hypothetical protein
LITLGGLLINDGVSLDRLGEQNCRALAGLEFFHTEGDHVWSLFDSAQAAKRGAKQIRNSSSAAARSESVVREFLRQISMPASLTPGFEWLPEHLLVQFKVE